MHPVERRGKEKFEDLMRDLEAFEQQLLTVDASMAMDLMVIEAKIRERFQMLEKRSLDSYTNLDLGAEIPLDDFSLDEIRALIPQDLPTFPALADLKQVQRRKRTLRTIGQATILAILTSMGVFALASVLQLVLTWIA